MGSVAESLYQKFWRMMNEVSKPRPMTVEARAQWDQDNARRRWAKLRGEVDTLKEFLSDARNAIDRLERSGLDLSRAKELVRTISRPISVLASTLEATQEAVQAAETVSLRLATWYREAERSCKDQAGSDSDQEAICMAQVSRQWQWRNVKAVLGAEPDSFTSLLWPKWRKRLLLLLF